MMRGWLSELKRRKYDGVGATARRVERCSEDLPEEVVGG